MILTTILKSQAISGYINRQVRINDICPYRAINLSQGAKNRQKYNHIVGSKVLNTTLKKNRAGIVRWRETWVCVW